MSDSSPSASYSVKRVVACTSFFFHTSLVFLFGELDDVDMIKRKAPDNDINRFRTIGHDRLHVQVVLIEIREEIVVEKYTLDLLSGLAFK